MTFPDGYRGFAEPLPFLLGWMLLTAPLMAAPSSFAKSRGQQSALPSTSDPLRPPQVAQVLREMAVGISRARLDNGLRVVMDPRPESSFVAVAIRYALGTRHESSQKAGLTELVRHLMFTASPSPAPGTFSSLVTSRGGISDAETSADSTVYYEVLPANELELALWLESDRMRGFSPTRSAIDAARIAVEEEYRARVANTAYAKGLMELQAHAVGLTAAQPGSDVRSPPSSFRPSPSTILDFIRRHHVPNRATITISGGFDPDQAMSLLRQYFEAIPPTDAILSAPTATATATDTDTAAPTATATATAAPTATATATATATLPELAPKQQWATRDPIADTAALVWAWPVPSANPRDRAELELLSAMLTDTTGSSLRRSLIETHLSFRQLSSWTTQTIGPDLITLMIELNPETSVSLSQNQVEKAVARLAQRGPTPRELLQAKRYVYQDFLKQMDPILSRARRLGDYEFLYRDARLLFGDQMAIWDVTAEQLRSAATRYLSEERSLVMWIQPRGSKREPGKTP